jgi:hypothetical protein
VTNLETSEAREERLAKNEVIFRTVNEAIEQKALQMGGLDVRFVVTPCHEDVEVELIVGTSGTYSIVEKDGSAGIVAEFADPRDGDPGHG